MSFFNDLIKNFDGTVGDDKLYISMVFGEKICLIGKFIVKDFFESLICIEFQNKQFKVIGESLKIKSVSKGELCVEGFVKGFVEVEWWKIK